MDGITNDLGLQSTIDIFLHPFIFLPTLADQLPHALDWAECVFSEAFKLL